MDLSWPQYSNLHFYTHFSMKNFHFRSKFFILNFWKRQFFRLLRSCTWSHLIFFKSLTSCLSKLKVLPDFPNPSLVCTLYYRCIRKEAVFSSEMAIFRPAWQFTNSPNHNSQLQFHNFTVHNFTISRFHNSQIHKVSGIFLHDNQVYMMGLHKWDSTYMMAS